MKNISIGQKEIIHFIGIGGIGMSGLAQVMKNMGFNIQGSDQIKNKIRRGAQTERLIGNVPLFPNTFEK